MAQTLIYEILIILTAGLIAGLVCRRLRVSVLIGYLVVGVLLGKGSFGWVTDDRHQIEYIAEAGVFLLLFTIGLEFSVSDPKKLGRDLLVGGSVQMLLVAVPVVAGLMATGMNWQPAVLIAAALAFSSTVLVFKALSERGHASEPHGRRAIGILLFQDAALVPLLLLIPLLTGTGEAAGSSDYFILAITSVLFVAAVLAARFILARWLIPLLTGYRTPELVILFTMVVLVGVTLGAYVVGLPPAAGAFAAGLVFNGNPWSKQIDALVLPFRETFAAIFFVSLGLIFDPSLVWREPVFMLACFVGLIALKAFAATNALRLTGLPWRGAFGMGIGLAHVGEFAFVLVLLGWQAGVLSAVEYNRVVAIAVGSLILTPPLLSLGLRWNQSGAADAETDTSNKRKKTTGNRATVIGAGPIGRRVTSQLETVGKDVCLIDLSPINLHPFAQEGFRTVAGDAMDAATLQRAHADEASLTAVCVPNDEIAIRVVRAVRSINPKGIILVRCRYQVNAPKLRRAGADEVVSEEVEASHALLKVLTKFDSQV